MTTAMGLDSLSHAAEKGAVVSVAAAVAAGPVRDAKACTATCWQGLQAVILARWQRLQLCAATHVSGPTSWHGCLSNSFTILEEVGVQNRAACAHGSIIDRAVELRHTCTSWKTFMPVPIMQICCRPASQ